MIVVEDLVKRFGAVTAVAGVSFRVEVGEVVGFLGPNGAGKTTTLRVLTCFHPATTGRAVVAGHDVDEDPIGVRRSVGYLPENVPIYTDLRVEEYLHYRARLKGVARARRKVLVEYAMERCGVLEVRRKLVGHVSRGYRQRVGLADALVARPPILILDEPTSGLDPNQRRRMKLLVRELAEEHTILFSSHILSEVQDVSSRILILHHGRLCADGTPQQLLERASGRRLDVLAHAPADVLRAALGDLPGLADVTIDSAPDGCARFSAALAPGADPRDATAAALAARGIPLRELKLTLPTLEQVFQQVTEGAGEHAPAGAVA